MEAFVERPRIVQLIPVPEALITVNAMGLTHRWDEPTRTWKEVFVSDNRRQIGPMLYALPLEALPRPIGPVYDPAGQRLLAVERSFTTHKLMVTAGSRNEDWESKQGVAAPPGTFALLREADGAILAVSILDIFRLEGDPLAAQKPVTVFGVEVPFTSRTPFRSVGPEPPIVLRPPAAAAMNDDTGVLAVYSRGVLRLLSKDKSGRYESRCERKLADDDAQQVVLGFGGKTLVVGRSDGSILVLDAETLKERSRFPSEHGSPARAIAASPEGRRFAVVFHSGRLWLLDAEQDSLVAAHVADQGDVSAAAFGGPDHLIVAHRSTRVTEYDLATGKVERRYAPQQGMVEGAYRYAVKPLYTVFPKPGKLDNTVEYLLSAPQASAGEDGVKNPGLARQRLHPWTPVWSSLAFAVFILALGCWYVQRPEF